MNYKILFPRRFTTAEQDVFLQQVADRFAIESALWQHLFFNGLLLGFINRRWRDLLVRDWQGEMQVCGDSLNLLGQDWLALGDALQTLTQDWHEQGEFQGWRNEKFDVCDESGKMLFALERSAFRPLGLLSHAVHINGMAEHNGETCFWIGRRSHLKAVDPDKLDNMVGGGVASGESIDTAMVREGWEEAGLSEDLLAGLVCRSRLLSLRGVSRGLHREWLHIFDVRLPEGVIPENQDGEVAAFGLMGVNDLAEAMAAGLFMNDAMVATLDCCRRLGLLDEGHPLHRWLVGLNSGSQLNVG